VVRKPDPATQQRTLKSLLTRLAAHANAADPVADTCAVVEDITQNAN